MMTLNLASDEGIFAFLLVFDSATLRFDVPVGDADAVIQDVGNGLRANVPNADAQAIRADVREAIRTGLLDNDHLHPVKGQRIANLVIYYALTGPNRLQAEAAGCRGFIIAITRKGGNEFNFRTMMVPGKAEVDEACAEARSRQEYVVKISKEEAERAARRKKTAIPRDPSLNPPGRPRPDRFIPALTKVEKVIGKPQVLRARECLEQGACFVFRSRQIAEESQEEIDASLAAMAEYDRLRLPFQRIWVETRDWMEIYRASGDAGPQKVEVHMGIAAYEEDDGAICFYGFADSGEGPVMSAVRGEVDRNALLEGKRYIPLSTPIIPDDKLYDEGFQRAIARAAGERLLELLFLLSTAGIAKEHVKAGTRPGFGSKGRTKKGKRRQREDRDYTIVRVPLHFDPEAETGGVPSGSKGGKGRWKRPHVRRAHMWGKNTRPFEEQRWVEATLVGAARLDGDADLKRPEYIV